MSDVLLGQSYYLRFDPKLWQAMQPYPPLGTMYAASYLRHRGYDVALYDAMLADSVEQWDEALARHRPRFAVLYEDNFNYLSKMCLLRMRQAAFTMIESARRVGCTVIVGGADPTDQAELYLSRGAHFVLLGEGEETLADLLDQLAGGRRDAAQAVPGLSWAGTNGIRSSGLRDPIRDLDALPFPAWDLIDVNRYRAAWLGRHGYFSLNMVTTRGCPYHCNWCANPIWGQRYSVRSPANVVAELKFLKETYRPDHIWFMDDIMGLKPGWLSQFADLVAAHQVPVPFKSLSRADLLLRDGAIDALRRAGCRTVWIGAESGSQAVLDAMEKGTRVEQIRAAAARLRGAGVEPAFFLQFGYPGESWGDIRKTFRLVWDCMPDDIGVSVSYPLPGTKFHQRVSHELGQKHNWQDSDDLAMLYRGPFSTSFYRTLHLALHREYRLRRAWLGLTRALSSPRTMRPGHLRALAATTLRAFTLPLLWLRLWWLRSRRQAGVGPLRPALSPTEAARPTREDPPVVAA
ncbi:MAG: B12-binding domain-containing radical SAM protein [Gemmatimonadetes bacterium]|nr:B12-binding domain-containing radical SAM protein [Gemmatimonadota bacterium]